MDVILIEMLFQCYGENVFLDVENFGENLKWENIQILEMQNDWKKKQNVIRINDGEIIIGELHVL